VQLKGNLVKLLKDDSEEVLQGLIPNINLMLECLVESRVIGTDKMVNIFYVIYRMKFLYFLNVIYYLL